jgi:hypothetical protein
MGNETFGDYINKAKEPIKLPLRKVAAQLEIYTSTLSKVEQGDRLISPDYLRPLADIQKFELK